MLTGRGAEYTVDICSRHTCSRPFFTRHSLGKEKIPCKYITQHTILLTSQEIGSIFESKKNIEPEQIWKVAKGEARVNASGCTCKSPMPAGKIHIVVNGLHIPRNQKFAVSRQLCFCTDPRIAIKPFASNIQTPPSEVDVMRDSQLPSEDMCLLRHPRYI